MKNSLVIMITLLLAMFAFGGSALAGKLEKEPGYFDLEWIEIPDDADEVQDIDLSTILRSVAKDAERSGDDELMEILQMVRSIRVKGFSPTDGHDGAVEDAVDRITKELKRKDWKRLVYVKSKDEVFSVSTKYDGDDLVGMVMVAYEPGEEVIFANVVGDLDLATLMKLVTSMDEDSLEELAEEMERQYGD
jgi:hypothetical protein